MSWKFGYFDLKGTVLSADKLLNENEDLRYDFLDLRKKAIDLNFFSNNHDLNLNFMFENQSGD